MKSTDIRLSNCDDEHRKPNPHGSLVYLNARDLDASLKRVSQAGGSVVLEKTDIGEPGFIALVRDCEGNIVGLHSPHAASAA